MGGWGLPSDKSVIVGDVILDRIHAMVKEFNEIYENEHHRKMSIRELEAQLNIVLKSMSGDLSFSDSEEFKIADVKFKLVKKNKEERKAMAVGSIYSIQIEKDKFAFARVMDISKRGTLVEIFKQIKPSAIWANEIQSSGRKFHPVYINSQNVLSSGSWNFICIEKGFKPADLNSLQFLIGVKNDFKMVMGNKQIEIDNEKAKSIERLGIYSHKALVKRINSEA